MITREKVGEVCVGEGRIRSVFSVFFGARISHFNNTRAYEHVFCVSLTFRNPGQTPF